MILTTSGGLYRYRLKDIVRVTGFAGSVPLIKFMGKQDKVSDLFGEKLNERFVQDTFSALGLVPPSMEPQGCFVELAESIKQVVSVPVITVGRIKTPELAERIIAENRADFVAVGRAQIADPEWCAKSFTGREAEINPCIACNPYSAPLGVPSNVLITKR